ncbi:TIGR04283 family arsenosugar biosynthesis glycosyltransferase [Zhongshania sp. BJYM1]|uniref:TIGR04283 family arsenosugar biosynthesis glycosyltransferase n=1 Tax=Zhongshania aquatica TaxID=2965069 RepID=UPI0022B3FD5C|nr:TIGR04283 family arsenosugar biosynthesis glycosyltransferase [Marortus sp. BJYM1]
MTSAAKTKPALSVVVPVLNEAAGLASKIESLGAHCQSSIHHIDVLFVDGGSHDNSVAIITGHGYSCINSDKGRAKQMNAGAAQANADYLLFLHADSEVPNGGLDEVINTLHDHQWGRFDIRVSGKAKMFAVISFFINWRSRLTGIATGDQGIFVRKSLFNKIGGFADQPLMEDIDLSTKLGKVSAPRCLRSKIITSGRRWQQRGIWKTIFLMWRLRFMYWFGVSPLRLAKYYE